MNIHILTIYEFFATLFYISNSAFPLESLHIYALRSEFKFSGNSDYVNENVCEGNLLLNSFVTRSS